MKENIKLLLISIGRLLVVGGGFGFLAMFILSATKNSTNDMIFNGVFLLISIMFIISDTILIEIRKEK
jgi:glycopeptide antibiotics resistance protein